MKLLFIVLFSILYIASAKVCTTSAECNDTLSCTIDFCEPKLRQCVHIATTSNCKTTFDATSARSLALQVNTRQLSRNDFKVILDTISHELNQHQPVQQSHLKLNLVSELKTLRDLVVNPNIKLFTNTQFHTSISSILKTVRNLKTKYTAPKPLRESIAFLPFSFRYNEQGKEPKYIVDDIAQGVSFRKPTFTKGVEIIKWNNQPIHSIKQGYKSTNDISLTTELQNLRVRLLHKDAIPRKKSVTVQYKSQSGKIESVVIDWLFVRQHTNVISPGKSSVARSWTDDRNTT